MAVQPRGVTKTADADFRFAAEEPISWLEAKMGDGPYSSTSRWTGETPNTWWGGYITYNSQENSFVIGTHNSAAKSTVDDKPAIVIARSTGKV